MNVIRTGGAYADVLRLINETHSPQELTEHLKNAKVGGNADAILDTLLARKRDGHGIIPSETALRAALDTRTLDLLGAYAGRLGTSITIEPTRRHFSTLLLSNPNYFGTIEGALQSPVFPMKGNTTYEALECVGLNTPLDRLEAVIEIKKNGGYSGGICTNGSIEWVRFFVDLHDNGVLHDVGLGWVRVYDIGGAKPLCYAVYKDFAPIRKRCTAENVVRVRAILSWNTQPQANNPNYAPVWGQVVDVMVQIRPRFFIDFGELVTELQDIKAIPIPIPDPIGPVIAQIDPAIKLPLAQPQPMTFREKRELSLKHKIPVHRYAFAESHQLLSASSATLTHVTSSPLLGLGLTDTEVKALVDALSNVGDGNTGFEELQCVGLKPEKDMLEAVFTIKRPFGYSGSLCNNGSTEYVAFWIDVNDGNGFTYVDTATMEVHDLQEAGNGVQYGVYVKKDLSPYLTSCEAGARIVRVRAILSWQVAPPPGNPNWVPVWGNREECLVQLRPGEGKLAALLEINDVSVSDIHPATGRATGTFVEASGAFVDAPFGSTIAVAGTIGLGTDFLGGGASPFKYRIEVKRDTFGSTYEPVVKTFKLRKFQRLNGFVIQCAPGETICEFDQTPLPPASEGGESGWYLYQEDLIGPLTQEILSDVLIKWTTSVADEDRWKLRLHVKDAANTHFFSDEVTIRVDNTAPTATLTLTSALLNGQPLPALECGKFPVGTVLSGTFSAHDPGTGPGGIAADFQHHQTAGLSIHPAGPASGVTPTTVPVSLTYNPPSILTTGVDGTWTLDTHGMQACGYVLRLDVRDRTIFDAGNASGYHNADEFGFCLEEPEG